MFLTILNCLVFGWQKLNRIFEKYTDLSKLEKIILISDVVSTGKSIDFAQKTISDITGKTVYTGAGIENGMSIDLSNLQSGVYLAKVTGASSERVEKLVIK